MARKLTATQLTENAGSLIEQIAEAATAEARRDIADRLAEMATDHKNLQLCLDEMSPRPLTDEFAAGLAFAARLLRDADFDI